MFCDTNRSVQNNSVCSCYTATWHVFNQACNTTYSAVLKHCSQQESRQDILQPDGVYSSHNVLSGRSCVHTCGTFSKYMLHIVAFIGHHRTGSCHYIKSYQTKVCGTHTPMGLVCTLACLHRIFAPAACRHTRQRIRGWFSISPSLFSPESYT